MDWSRFLIGLGVIPALIVAIIAAALLVILGQSTCRYCLRKVDA